MKNFAIQIPTAVYFGKGQIEHLPELLSAYRSILLVYGGSSIKRNGLYDTVRELLKDKKVSELSGVSANPQAAKVREGIRVCRENSVDCVLAVGGGSVTDCSKAICLGVYAETDAWEMIVSFQYPSKALPLVTVATMAAAGSDMTAGAVISNAETNEKLSLFSELLFPAAAILDPVYTFTVPPFQTAAGSADILSHLMEQYFVKDATYLEKEMVEGVMRTVVHYAPIAYHEPENYEARASLLWASQMANNQTLACGIDYTPFSCHGIEHELSAYYNITHGAGLAVVTPHWMEYVLSEDTEAAFARFARNVFHVEEKNDHDAAEQGIEALREFYRSLNLPLTYEVKAEDLPAMAEHAVAHEMLESAYVSLHVEDIIKILEDCAK